ncbi:MAG: SDR family NAD(P)-dependent oxidoreductase [Lachnospiraceae bacterium]
MKMQGKNVIITGSNRGIGKAILECFASEGAFIWACARKETPEFISLIEKLEKRYSASITPIYFDMLDEENVKTAAKKIISYKIPIDVLINNAGISYSGLFSVTSTDKLKEVFQVNYFSQVLLTQLISRVMMRQKSGSIINMASVGGIEANPGYLAYGSSKAALIWETRCLAKELANFGIRVNAVAPGLVDTDMGYVKSDEEIEKVLKRTPLNRMADADEIAKAVLYLASDDSSFVTGHVLKVDGGRSC